MFTKPNRRLARDKRHRRVRKRVRGSATRPRLSVFRSLRHLTVQLINDDQGHTIAYASTVDPEVRKQIKQKTGLAAAAVVGDILGQRAQAGGVTEVVFDRGGYPYQGQIAELANAVRKKGVKF